VRIELVSSLLSFFLSVGLSDREIMQKVTIYERISIKMFEGGRHGLSNK